MTLEDYRLRCGWSKNEMARQAGMDFTTLQKALKGEEPISQNTAHKLASAISRHLGQTIRPLDIEGLNISA